MYEMQGPRPVRRCRLTDCSAARHCLTDHCYQVPVRGAGCPAPRPFSEFPPGAVPVFSGDEFLQPQPDPAQGFSRSNFKIF